MTNKNNSSGEFFRSANNMFINIQKKMFSSASLKMYTIGIVSFLFLTLAVLAQMSYTLLNSGSIHKGVYVNGVNVGNMSTDTAFNTLKSVMDKRVSTTELEIKSKDASEIIRFSEAGLAYDIKEALDNAYNVGRNGNAFQRLYEILLSGRYGTHMELQFSYNSSKVEGILNSLYNKTLIKVKEADLLFQDDKVTLRSGHHGESFDKESAMEEIGKAFKNCEGGTLEFNIINTPPSRINVDEYFRQINRDAQDARFSVENNSVTVIPQVMGRSIDKQTLTTLTAELEKTENSEKVLPVVFTKPKLSKEDLQSKLFKDTLATSHTQFYTGNQNDSNRGENIRIAVSKINGTILLPGDEFSFNQIVGPRTEDFGYKIAHVYSEGKIVDDVGGGICQVSTTLYNSVLYSDLYVNERTNHMFTVGYVPLGRDAAVAYDSTDFRFSNSTGLPIKLEGWVTRDNQIYFAIKGTVETPGKTVEIVTKPVKTLDFTTKYIKDSSMYEDQVEVLQEGMTGYIVDTFKVIKKDGKVQSETKLHTSTYNPLTRELKRGTKKWE